MKNKFLVYSCSGCSSAAQTANEVALRLNEQGVAQMSCTAGIGGNVTSLIKLAQKNDKKKILIDGCSLSCTKKSFELRGIHFDKHIELNGDYNIKKKKGRYKEDDVVNVMFDLKNNILK